MSLDKGYIMCECCGERVKLRKLNSPQIYCDYCKKNIEKEKTRLRVEKYRKCNGSKEDKKSLQT